jgi:hypothetical protein
MNQLKQYPKNLDQLTTFRLSSELRQDAETCAKYLGVSFSDFLRQSLGNYIYASRVQKDNGGHIKSEVIKDQLS